MSYQYSRDPEENLPDWLKELRRRQREAEQAARQEHEDVEPGEQPPAQKQPEKQEIAPEEPVAQTDPESPSTLSEAEPDWLMEIRRRHEKESTGPAPRELPQAPPEEHPVIDADEALGDTQPIQAEPKDTATPAPADEWDWEAEESDASAIGSQGDTEPTETEPASVAPAQPSEQASVDQWDWEAEEVEASAQNRQSEDGPAENEPALSTQAEPAEQPGEAEDEPLDEEIPEPDWLSLDADEDAATSEQPELPDWLMQGDAAEGSDHTPAFTEAGDSDLSPAELPSWLQALRPPSRPNRPIETSSSRDLLPEQESVGPLAGLSGVLQAEPEIVQFGKPRMPTGQLDITEGQQRHAARFQHLIAQEGRPKEDFGQQAALPSRILNLVIAGALLLATSIPLLIGSQTATAPLSNAYPLAPPVFNQIEVLPNGAPVMVVFDVEPGLYGEMAPAASQVLRHLLAQEARLVLVSTQPTGPALAERLLQEHLNTDPNIGSGNYINLGYLSGGMAALRAFASDPRAATTPIPGLPNDPWQLPALQSIQSLDDFGMLLVISSETEDARAWIEQSAGVLGNGLYMVTSAQVAPLLRPYAASHPQTLRGLVAGLAGAAHYEALQGTSGPGRAAWDAFSYGLGAVALAILLGGLYNRLIHLRPVAPIEDQHA